MSIQQAAVVDVGTPASGFQGWETAQVLYHGFADLTMRKGKSVKSPEFTCLGHQWRLEIFPGGRQNSDDGMVGVVLRNMSVKSIKLDCYGLSVKNSDGVDVANCRRKSSGSLLFETVGTPNYAWGITNFAKRSDMLSALVGGTLVIEVRMRCADSNIDPPPFVAENPSRDMVRKMFLDEKSADVVFGVGEDSQQIQDSRKRARAGPVEFHAHRFVLKQSAPMLAALCPPGDGVVSVAITDIAPEVFRPLLHYLYGGEVSDDEFKSHTTQIIEVADRYEIVGLKLAAEAWCVQSTKINFDNVMEMLIFSDAKNLALLKEAIMDFIVANGEEVLQKVSLKEAPEGLFADILAATARRDKKDTGNVSNLNTMRISDLRKMLHEKGLGIDGSREALIAALEQNK